MTATFMGHVLPTWIGAGIDRETGMLAGSIEVSGERMRAWLPAGKGAAGFPAAVAERAVAGGVASETRFADARQPGKQVTPDDLMAGLPGAAPTYIVGEDPLETPSFGRSFGIDPALRGDYNALVVRQGDTFVMATSDPKEIASILAEASGEDEEMPF